MRLADTPAAVEEPEGACGRRGPSRGRRGARPLDDRLHARALRLPAEERALVRLDPYAPDLDSGQAPRPGCGAGPRRPGALAAERLEPRRAAAGAGHPPPKRRGGVEKVLPLPPRGPFPVRGLVGHTAPLFLHPDRTAVRLSVILVG